MIYSELCMVMYCLVIYSELFVVIGMYCLILYSDFMDVDVNLWMVV